MVHNQNNYLSDLCCLNSGSWDHKLSLTCKGKENVMKLVLFYEKSTIKNTTKNAIPVTYLAYYFQRSGKYAVKKYHKTLRKKWNMQVWYSTEECICWTKTILNVKLKSN